MAEDRSRPPCLQLPRVCLSQGCWEGPGRPGNVTHSPNTHLMSTRCCDCGPQPCGIKQYKIKSHVCQEEQVQGPPSKIQGGLFKEVKLRMSQGEAGQAAGNSVPGGGTSICEESEMGVGSLAQWRTGEREGHRAQGEGGACMGMGRQSQSEVVVGNHRRVWVSKRHDPRWLRTWTVGRSCRTCWGPGLIGWGPAGPPAQCSTNMPPHPHHPWHPTGTQDGETQWASVARQSPDSESPGKVPGSVTVASQGQQGCMSQREAMASSRGGRAGATCTLDPTQATGLGGGLGPGSPRDVQRERLTGTHGAPGFQVGGWRFGFRDKNH